MRTISTAEPLADVLGLNRLPTMPGVYILTPFTKLKFLSHLKSPGGILSDVPTVYSLMFFVYNLFQHVVFCPRKTFRLRIHT